MKICVSFSFTRPNTTTTRPREPGCWVHVRNQTPEGSINTGASPKDCTNPRTSSTFSLSREQRTTPRHSLSYYVRQCLTLAILHRTVSEVRGRFKTTATSTKCLTCHPTLVKCTAELEELWNANRTEKAHLKKPRVHSVSWYPRWTLWRRQRHAADNRLSNSGWIEDLP